jgi:precorrin-6B methylase 2
LVLYIYEIVKRVLQHGMEGRFYVQPEALIVDPDSVPESESQENLRVELEDYEALMSNDHAYCTHVEGAAQESNLWVPRNQHETFLTEADLQRFKNVAWNECVVKKFLAGRDGAADTVGQSMIDIVRNLNLQWGRLHIMGLHPKVESAEKQVVMVCMDKGLLPFGLDVGKVSRSLRRCEHFRDFFANAVGGQVVANTGRTPGLAKTQYGTDMDYAYKNKTQFFLERALQKYKHMVEECLNHADNEDYVERLAKLRVVAPTSYEMLNSTQPPDRLVMGGSSGISGVLDGMTMENTSAELRRQQRNIEAATQALQAMLNRNVQQNTDTFQAITTTLTTIDRRTTALERSVLDAQRVSDTNMRMMQIFRQEFSDNILILRGVTQQLSDIQPVNLQHDLQNIDHNIQQLQQFQTQILAYLTPMRRMGARIHALEQITTDLQARAAAPPPAPRPPPAPAPAPPASAPPASAPPASASGPPAPALAPAPPIAPGLLQVNPLDLNEPIVARNSKKPRVGPTVVPEDFDANLFD